ncbi:hypothetical protein FGSG_01547 [Fusarium graminearum PH-1]|uniref:Uncharacterized protein n=1 Tax=Gibberella zeae (strain ATCC MYA-4620 / CBS 123657 / FGSC 9075 / NRRL 31084 / PH-1) TaxID=229533 RepID=I1RD58_GIBZE|nr:hypothetical protein FGSG_01547 [Fusarium graminearum PH-1]ESU06873.1 hypothetical protein FGSG_01547 [Fusarium graminearum PH-1]|eukprot:XP_011317358.1 hypothetical protein FGSG_01547 [Fusarium graminearum PH-1]
MGLTHYHDQRADIGQGASSISQKMASSSSHIFRRLARRENCKDDNSCAQSSVSNSLVLPIVVAIINMKKQMLEDAHDPHKSLDFGLGDEGGAKKSARRSIFMGGGEKTLAHKPSQLSMDMNLSSPYLLPPGLQESRESLNSLAKSLGNDNQDPYQYVAAITQSETGSLRSFNPKDSHSRNTKFNSPRNSGKPGSLKMPPSRMNSLPETPVSATESRVDPFGTPKMPAPAHPAKSPFDSEKDAFHPAPIVPEIGVVSDFDEKNAVPSVQQPPIARSKTPDFELPNFSQEPATDFPLPPAREHEATGLGLNFSLPQPKSPTVSSPEAPKSAPLAPNRQSEVSDYAAADISSYYEDHDDDARGGAPAAAPAPRAAPKYYEDYDQGYMGGDQAYFDPETNAFVMPYAQPVTRRAMTPPPAGRRPGPGRPGPRPRGPNGSIGGMSFHSGPGGRSRAGSALGPRPDSSASARMRQPPMKRMPPPAPLTTLPTPSKLRDDNSFLINAADFAPPSNIRDTAAGRSQSPFGERRAYSPSVPAAQTLVSPFEELSALPSPHSLRKSSTFTGLDFAPPKRFKDSDNMSDAGSIRSNRSGMSQAQLGAIRNGAGRVSRLPGDQVFTADALQDTLKPSWGIRP